jgi:NAD-dependent DNA ligase
MAKRRKYTEFPNPTSKVGSLIKRRRLQMLIHSCLYYEMDTEIVSDDKWQEWANELAILLKNHPNEYSDEFDEHFKEWDGTTGYNLPHRNPWIYGKAEALLKYAI